MAITGVEGNIKYATTCLERERQEEALLAKQVIRSGRERHACQGRELVESDYEREGRSSNK